MKILLTGANGQLGRCIQDRVSPEDNLLALESDQLDITDREKVISLVLKEQPKVIINAAAYTAVDKAENEAELAFKVNHLGIENLALAAREIDIPLIHISTDYVFDGTATTPYTEDFSTSPLSVYGQSKWLGEEVLRRSYDNHIILRTSWVFSEYGSNFVKTILRLSHDKDEINIISDQVGCPTYAGDIASAIFSIIKKIQAGNKSRGTFHYCGDKPTTWHGFVNAIINESYAHKKLSRKTFVNAIKTEDYPLPAQRPKYSMLNCQKIQEVWNISQLSWRSAIKKVIEQL